MTKIQWVEVLWCDDIRQEIGRKLTFVGVYPEDIRPPELPCALDRLCMVIDLHGDEGFEAGDYVVALTDSMERALVTGMFSVEFTKRHHTDDSVDQTFKHSKLILQCRTVQLDKGVNSLRVVLFKDGTVVGQSRPIPVIDASTAKLV